MPNQYVNKVIVNGQTKIDLTGDTISADKLLSGFTAHDHTGASISGSCSYDADTTDANAVSAEILTGRTAYVSGQKVTGSMANNGSVSGAISTVAGTYTVPAGYHDGGGSVQISSAEQAKIIAGNIKSGIEILGVTGNYGGEAVVVQSKTATPSFSTQQILPDAGYDYLSQVNIEAIPVSYADNPQGGQTLTIG